MTTALMVADAVVAVLLIAAVVLQSGKSAGLGTIDGGAETFFGGKAKGLDLMLSKATMLLALIFAMINLILSKQAGGI